VPPRPWPRYLLLVSLLVTVLTGAWEWRMRGLGLLPGDFSNTASTWAVERRRVDTEDAQVVIIGDSRILFDTDLDRFQSLTGERPIQLALQGTNCRPFLEDLAADPHFRGLLIVGIAETSYFRERIGLFEGALKRVRFESPSERVGQWLDHGLSRYLGFLDPEYRLSVLVKRLDPDIRSGVQGPYDQVWKINTMGEDRQTWMWSRIETDPRLQAHARAVWNGFKGDKVDDALIARTLEKTRVAVDAIRARGGEVVFVRPPSAPQLRVNEDQRIPRVRGWDPLLAAAHVQGVHVDDLPGMQDLVLPEYSHLNHACATVFTDAYVRRLTQLTPRLKLRKDAPSPLGAADCVPQAQVAMSAAP